MWQCWWSFSLEKTDVLIDNCLSGLFAFHTSVNLSELALAKANKLVLQDRASCLPPFVLQLQAGDIVQDCCVAPGNKTHQLAEFVGAKGKVLACEADPKLYKLLSNRMDLELEKLKLHVEQFTKENRITGKLFVPNSRSKIFHDADQTGQGRSTLSTLVPRPVSPKIEFKIGTKTLMP